jgi:hypothetical protein
MGIKLRPKLVGVSLLCPSPCHTAHAWSFAKPAFQCSWGEACTALTTQVDLLFYLFSDGQDNLNIRYLYEVMNRHITTGLNMACEFVWSARWC